MQLLAIKGKHKKITRTNYYRICNLRAIFYDELALIFSRHEYILAFRE